METSITINSKDLGRYLHSLDSVRFSESDFVACKLQAKLEVFSSLMLGRTIPIGEHQFIDSYGLLLTASELLAALHSFPESDRARLVKVFPFQLFFRQEFQTLDTLIATKIGDSDYKLSLWQSLGDANNVEMKLRREEIKKKILMGNFKYEEDDLVPEIDKNAARMLHTVRNKFVQGEQAQISTLYGAKSVDFTTYNGLVEVGINKICSFTEKDLIVQLERQEEIRKLGFEPTIVFEHGQLKHAKEIISELNCLRNLGLLINNRSHIRIGKLDVHQAGGNEIRNIKDMVENKSLYIGLLEVYDLLYNASIAKASSAHTESVSASRNISSNPYLSAANALVTLAKNEVTDQAEIDGDFFNPPWIQDFSFSVTNPTVAEKMLESMPWSSVWEAYLDSNWRNSVEHLNEVLNKWDCLINNPDTSAQKYIDIVKECDDAYIDHIKNVSEILKTAGWDYQKDQKINKFVIRLLPLTGGLIAEEAFKLIFGEIGLDTFWEEKMPGPIGTLVAGGITAAIPPVGEWLTKGYIRKTFARLLVH